MMTNKAIIIGAGVAGLASAIRLASKGMEVHVYEKNNEPGGKMGLMEKNGYRFDTGPSLFTQPSLLEELFETAGDQFRNYCTYQTSKTACTYFYQDDTSFVAPAESQLFATKAAEFFQVPEQVILDYLRQAAVTYDNIANIFLNRPIHKATTWFTSPITKALRSVKWKLVFESLHQLNEHHFKNKKLEQLFDRYATYNGSNPYQAPGMLHVIPHLEYNDGVYYPQGGMISIANALYKLACRHGVSFYFNKPVERIIQSDDKVQGVVVDNQNISADVVVSNVDAYFTYKHLLANDDAANKLLRQERSSSALIFYWGIKRIFPQLGLHNIFFSGDYNAEFDHIFKFKKPYTDPTIYINITSKYEPGVHAPDGCENWFVMINMPACTDMSPLAIENCKKSILTRLSRQLKVDVASLIDSEAILDPATIQLKTGSYMGSLYGTSSNSKWAAFLRHPNFSKNIKGLYFSGGSVHPGGGIPLCLRSAKIVSELILDSIN